jgi:hypothetical protein
MNNATPAQREVLLQLVKDGGPLRRLAGGFWTTATAERLGVRPGVPAWSTQIQTPRAMVKYGLLRRLSNTEARAQFEWLDQFVLTDYGRLIAALVPGALVVYSDRDPNGHDTGRLARVGELKPTYAVLVHQGSGFKCPYEDILKVVPAAQEVEYLTEGEVP